MMHFMPVAATAFCARLTPSPQADPPAPSAESGVYLGYLRACVASARWIDLYPSLHGYGRHQRRNV